MTPQQAPNFAPQAELEDARKQPATVKRDLLTLAKSWRDELRQEGNSEEWRIRRKAAQKNEFFYRGYQRLRPADLTNTWIPEDPKPIHYTYNEFQFWANTNKASWLAAKSEFRFAGKSDTADSQLVAGKLRVIADHYNDKLYDRTATGKCSMRMQFEGALVAFIFYDQQAKSAAYRPVTDRIAPNFGPQVYRCADCNFVGEIEQDADTSGREQLLAGQRQELGVSDVWGEGGRDGMASAAASGNYTGMATQPRDGRNNCQQCGSPNIALEGPTGQQEYTVETGKESYQTGDINVRYIPIYNITWTAFRGLAGSPAVLWEEEHTKDELEATYQGIQLPQSAPASEALSQKQVLDGSRSTKGKLTLSRLWVEPSKYHNVELEQAVQTYAGVEFPAGLKLAEQFPRGCHLIMIGDLIVDLYAAVKEDDLSYCGYHEMPNGGLPQGVDAACEPQRNLNTAKSLINLWLRHHAVMPARYNPQLIDPGDISGDPTRPYPINADNLGLREGFTMKDAIVYDQPPAMVQGIFAFAGEMRSLIQFAFGQTSFTEGLPNVDNQTLGGARIAQSLAQSVAGTVLAGFADHKADVIKKVLKKFRQYCWDERYIQFAGTHGVYEGILASAMDIPEDFEVSVVPNSWLPRTAEQRQQNLQNLLLAANGWAGLATMPAAIRAELCDIYDVQLRDNDYPVAIRTVRMRLAQMKEMLPLIEQVNELQTQAMPMMQPSSAAVTPQPSGQLDEGMAPLGLGEQLFAALVPPFNPREAGQQEAAEYLCRWFVSDEGFQAEQALIDAAGILQDAHIQAAGMQATIRAGVEMAGQPMPLGMPPLGGGKPQRGPQMGALTQGAGG